MKTKINPEIIRIGYGRKACLMTLDRALRLLVALNLVRPAKEPERCPKCGR